MNGRESDADFGRALRHGKGIASIVVAVVIATAGVIGAAYSLAKDAAASESAKTFASENGAKTWGDAGITPRQQLTGLYTLEFADALALDAQSAILITRRGVAMRYYVSAQHYGDTVRRVVVRDFAAGLLDCAFDVLVLAQSGSAALGEHCKGSVTSAGALLSGTGFAAARSSAGIYTLTLTTPIAAAACVIQAARRGTGGRYFVCVDHTNDQIRTVRVVDHTDTYTDSAFDFSIWAAA